MTEQETTIETNKGERGSAIVISLFVLALISVFVALALTRSSAEAMAVGNETAEARTFYAAQGSLEMMTRNFNKVFETKLNPTVQDLNNIRNAAVPGMTNYTFVQELDQTSSRQNVVLSGGPYSGLYAIRDNWRIRSTATDNQGIQVQLTRNILNSRIPIFQFGIFYDDDLELFRPPRFSFGGRVHSNRNFFVSPGSEGVYFDSKVTAAGEIVTQSWRNWYTGDSSNAQTFIKNASGVFQQLQPTMGSVLNTTSGASNNIFAGTDLPPSRENTSFSTQAAIFDGNLEHETQVLRLPLKVGYPTDLVEIIRRGKNIASPSGGDLYQDATGNLAPVTAASQDDDILRSERYANKPGIRVSLADSKAKLPGCASGTGTAAITGPCGARLDGDYLGQGTEPNTAAAVIAQRARGYQPLSMKLSTTDTGFGYTPTRVNGERLYMGGLMPAGRTQEVWIKVELVSIIDATQTVVTRDITQDFLSLGMTEEAPASITLNAYSGTKSNNGTATSPSTNLTSTSTQTPSTYPDSRSIIKIQRFMMPGPAVPGGSNVLTSYGSGSTAENVVRRFTNVDDTKIAAGCASGCTADDAALVGDSILTFAAEMERFAHLKRATVNSVANVAIVPFPIQLFDTREGEYYDQRSTTYYSDLSRLTRNGVMSIIDIDIANLRRFLRGDFNGLFPTTTPFAIANGSSLRNTDVPQREGWIFYVSDRRGDADFDGELDMEDIYASAPGNDGLLQVGEDVNGDGVLDARYWGISSTADLRAETERYNTNTILPDRAAVVDQKYYRRGVRLINGTVVPGIYDSTTPANTRGFTFASENGVYVDGNYNATGVSSVPSVGNTPFDQYLPQNTATHIPASIVGDAITILSNGWNDAQSFSSPYDEGGRIGTTTQMRFAMISGDTIASREISPNQGGITPNLNGGVHNFKRFLERWTGNRLDYAGSLINLYNSRNNNGSFKCCNTVYDPPIRNWVFDSTFLDPSRLPPGTPFFQYVQTTGFQRTND
jgi:Tfp pilus assembly protein PilX